MDAGSRALLLRGARVGLVAGLAVVVWRRVGGTDLRLVLVGLRPAVVLAALALTAVSTVCAALRWRLLSGAVGLPLSLGSAVASCYRAQFLNTVLPGGVLGDLERGVRHGRRNGAAGRGLLTVAGDRVAGQVVQVCLALALLSVLPSPVRSVAPRVALVLLVLCVLGVLSTLAARSARRRRSAPSARRAPPTSSPGAGVARAQHRLAATLSGRSAAWVATVALLSAVAVAAHLATFVLAARAVGVSAPTSRLLPLLLLALLAMAVPLGVAGWGPREGVAVWAFGAAGLGAAHGLQTAVAYGLLVLLSCLPGALVLLRREAVVHG